MVPRPRELDTGAEDPSAALQRLSFLATEDRDLLRAELSELLAGPSSPLGAAFAQTDSLMVSSVSGEAPARPASVSSFGSSGDDVTDEVATGNGSLTRSPEMTLARKADEEDDSLAELSGGDEEEALAPAPSPNENSVQAALAATVKRSNENESDQT